MSWNWFDLLSLSATLVVLLMGLLVFHYNSKSVLNRLFLLTSLAAFIYEFSTVMMWVSSNIESATLWHKIGTMWPLFVALVLNLALVLTKSNWIKNKKHYLILYSPAIAFWLIDLFTSQINGPPVLKYWGYNDVASANLIYYISTVWTAVLPVIALILCFRSYRKETDSIKRLQAKYVTIGFSTPIVTFIITNMLTRSLGIDFPNLGVSTTLFFSVFVGFAIIKYELFTLESALTSEKVIVTIPDAFILSDENGKILKVNDRLVGFLGYDRMELTSKFSISQLIAKDEKQTWEKIISQLNKENLLNYEIEFKTKSGEIRHVLFSGSLVRSKKGTPLGITCIMKDITSRIEMEHKLLKSERLASIGVLAGQIGHDLRNPLAAIKNSVYLIEKKGALIPEVKQACEYIKTSIVDSDRIISSLVDYAQDLHLKKGICTPKSLTQNALSKVTIPDRIILSNLVTNETELFLDAQKIENAFTRIIQNAIDAMPQLGTLEITSQPLNESIMCISFTDSGTGISETVLPNLFSPLTTTKAKGMGMSLAICKRIVDEHKGAITFETKQGQGSTFNLMLPINRENLFLAEGLSLQKK